MSPLWRRAQPFIGAAWLIAYPQLASAQTPALSAAVATLNADDCVALAVKVSPTVAEATGRVHEFEARLREIESVWYPKLSGMAFVAPAFTVRGNGFDPHPEIRWKSPRDWGPYTSLELTLAQPIYSFGRVAAGTEAARARTAVEQARLEEAGQAVALEVRRLYYTRLFALSMVPALAEGEAMVTEAQRRALSVFEGGEGEITQVDLAKLEFALNEIRRHRLAAEVGEGVALAALKHTMGLPQTADVAQADAVLPAPRQGAPPALPALLQRASQDRPQWAQLAQGRRAALKWEEAERLAVWPTVVVAGVFGGAWTPTHDRDTNNWHYDIYNKIVGGVALGLKIDLDPALARAKAQVAHSQLEQVDAMRRFAATGIPLQVRRAHDTLEGLASGLTAAQAGMAATRRWMRFAASAYSNGTGDARDMLEGMTSYLQSRRSYLEALQQHHIAWAELAYAVGVAPASIVASQK